MVKGQEQTLMEKVSMLGGGLTRNETKEIKARVNQDQNRGQEKSCGREGHLKRNCPQK